MIQITSSTERVLRDADSWGKQLTEAKQRRLPAAIATGLQRFGYALRAEHVRTIREKFKKPSAYTVAAPWVRFNAQELSTGRVVTGVRSSARYQNTLSMDLRREDAPRVDANPPISYLSPQALGGSPMPTKTQGRVLPAGFAYLTPVRGENLPSGIRRTQKRRPISSEWRRIAGIINSGGPGFFAWEGGVGRRGGSLGPPGIYRTRQGSRRRGARPQLVFHFLRAMPNLSAIYAWDQINQQYADRKWQQFLDSELDIQVANLGTSAERRAARRAADAAILRS